MNKSAPHLSIIIPAYNRPGLLANALDSCAASAPDLEIEVLVVDDASTEPLQQIVKERGALYHRLDRNSGSSAARNRGLELCRGEYVKFLDSDDVLNSGALQQEFEAARSTGADVVVAAWTECWLHEDGSETDVISRIAPQFTCIFDDLLAGRAVPTSAALYARHTATRVTWDTELSKLNDWDYFVNATMHASRVHTLPVSSYRWRQHSGERITSSSTFLKNSLEVYAILGKIEAALTARGALTEPRQRRLAQYLYKELRGLYRFRHPARDQIYRKILALDPAFQPRDEEPSITFRALSRIFPLRWLLEGYGLARAGVDNLQRVSP